MLKLYISINRKVWTLTYVFLSVIEGGETYPSWFVAVLIAFIICLTAAFSVMCFMLCKCNNLPVNLST